jgi:hypothetical protein
LLAHTCEQQTPCKVHLPFSLPDTPLPLPLPPSPDSCLYYAAQNGQVDVVKLLLSCTYADALMMRSHVNGSTCLPVAALHGHWDVVKALLYHKGQGAAELVAKGGKCRDETFLVNCFLDAHGRAVFQFTSAKKCRKSKEA